MKHLTASPDLGNLGEPYRSVVAKALDKDPEKRTSSAEEMLHQLGLKEMDGYVATLDSRRPSTAAQPTSQVEASPEPVYAAKVVEEPSVSSRGAFDDEPIAQAVGGAGERFMRWWNHNNTSMPVKIVVLIAVAFGIVTNLYLILPVGLVLGAFYLAYLFIRLIINTFNEDASVGGEPQSKSGSRGGYHPEAMKRKHRAAENAGWQPKRKDRERAALAHRPVRERVRELIGSLIASGLTAIVVSFVLLLITVGENLFEATPILTYGPSFVFFTGVTVMASWAVLVASKLWERRRGEHARRRIIMAMVGAGIGLFAWGASYVLLLPWPASEAAISGWCQMDGSATVGQMMLFFGLAFLVPCWWKMADPLRTNWLSLGTIGMYVAWAAVLSLFWTFAQPCGVMLIGAIATTVQFSAPWLNEERRDLVRRRYEQELKETTVSTVK